MQTLIAALTAFVATNIDDLVVLALLYAPSSERLRSRHIWLGQYLGFAVLILLSLPGFLGGLVLPKPWIGLLGFIPIAIGLKAALEPEEEPSVQTVTQGPNQFSHNPLLEALFAPQTVGVAAIRVANGGDNISVYLSLFAGQTWAQLGLTLLVFFGLVGVWCGAAYGLVQHPAVSGPLTRFGHRLVPLVLIGLGLYILFENETYSLLTPP
ncbi:MAG TPA: cadmium resistance transporter [Trichocoleus sp.]